MFTCPGCGDLVEAITTIHPRNKHNGMSKAEFKRIYGEMNYSQPPSSREYHDWLNNYKTITSADFEVAQSLGNKR